MTDKTNAYAKWSNDEEQQLINEYINQKLDINEISLLHNRNIGGICSRLRKLNIVDKNCNIRGYKEYINSKEYKHINRSWTIEDKENLKKYYTIDNLLVKEISQKLDRPIIKIMYQIKILQIQKNKKKSKDTIIIDISEYNELKEKENLYNELIKNNI